ncbi:hypothetical protein Rhopal_006170-T1 [Rhodotorula paludigena]|uniref:Uncharacterized protein n=1 Tax=Rhodotorula paludigena TaxID=86838 RepID=A0AAV5GKJ1_9BASI|nr:hypothetical protein Rhopal_006170-T1 [Rhodotorula paludigena]
MDGCWDDDEGDDQGCYVYWDTPSLFAPKQGSSTSAASTSSPRRRPSQRSGAPSPSLGPQAPAAASATPKPKRTTTAAALPSPSGSAAGGSTRALRQRKKRKPGRRGAAEPSSQPLDARTLEMVSQLAMKVNARAAGIVSPAVGKTSSTSREDRTAQGTKGKGKAANVEVAKREPLRPSPNANLASGSTTPFRRTPARAGRTAQTTLSLGASKPSLSRTSPSPRKKSAPPPAAPPPPARAPPALPALAKTISTATISVEDEDSFFDDLDESFELALSQLDESALVPTPPSSLAPAAAAAAPSAPAAPSTRPPAPAASRKASLAAAPPCARPAPPPAGRPSSLILHTSRASQRALSPSKQRALEELAQKEVEALSAAALLGDEGWSDDEF